MSRHPLRRARWLKPRAVIAVIAILSAALISEPVLAKREAPDEAAEIARWIFLSALDATGDYWQAVGAYHSPTASRHRAYATKVAVHMRARFGPDVFATRGAKTGVKRSGTAAPTGQR